MFYPQSERQRRFVALAEELAARFAARAAEHDRNGTFPFENYAEIRAAGLPALVVPESLGGWGASLSETVMAMDALAGGDGSTALSLTMHMQTLGAVSETQTWPLPLFEEVCRAAVEDGALVNAVATEPELGSPSRGGKPKTTATPVPARDGRPGAWMINGRKSFASMSPVLDYIIVPASLQDGSETVARFLIPRGDGIRIEETWDAMGMRTTGSHDLILTDVHVPSANIIGRSDSAKPSGGKINAWFMLTVSAVYVGVAVAALTAAARYARERVPTALGKPIAELESIQRHLGEAELRLHQARMLLYHTAELWERHPESRSDLGLSVVVAKVTATNAAIDAVDHCMRVVGGAGMTRRLPVERFYRDVRGGLTHPVNDDQALIMLGQQALREVATVESAVSRRGV